MPPEVFRLVLVLPLIAFLLYMVMTVKVALMQKRYVYVPGRRTVETTPASLGLAYEPLVINTADGERLCAWFVPAPQERPFAGKTILFCHGNAGNLGDLMDWISTFHRLGFAMLMFDYRGFGESSGTPGEEGTYRDAAACLDYLVNTRHVQATDVIVYGHSLGGAVASHLVAGGGPGLLVLESVFSSVPAMAQRMFPYLPTRRFCRIQYNNVEHVSRVSVPVLVLHSRTDGTCPFEQGQRVYEAAREPKRFVEITGDHNDVLNSNPDCQQAFMDFVRKRMP